MVSKFDDPPENCLSSKIATIIVSLIWFTHFKYFFFKPLDIKGGHSSFSGLRLEVSKLQSSWKRNFDIPRTTSSFEHILSSVSKQHLLP